MDVFYKYGTDFYILVRNGTVKYFLDLNVDETGISQCDCADFLFRRQKYADQGILDSCKHILALKEQLKKERE